MFSVHLSPLCDPDDTSRVLRQAYVQRWDDFQIHIDQSRLHYLTLHMSSALIVAASVAVAQRSFSSFHQSSEGNLF